MIMRARLTLEAGDALPTNLDVPPNQPATRGRSRDNAVVLKDDLASRLHAKVYQEDGRWFVRDFGLNGTKVNGVKISGSTELTDGALLQIGDTRFRFALVADVPSATPTATTP